MKRTTHTPGPWKRGGWGGRYILDTSGDVVIGVVVLQDATPEQTRADGDLMAAAPELLDALKEARSMLETASRYFPKSIRNLDRFSLLNVLANTVNPAIAKAEGKAE